MRNLVCLLLIVSGGIFAQDTALRFSAASVKLSPPPERPKRPNPGAFSYDPIRFAAQNMPLRVIILEAYGLQQYQLTGVPSWAESENYDIVASAEKEATKAEMRRMLQSLLEERFHLTIQRETKVSPVLAMTVSKEGLKLGPDFHEVKPDDPRPTYPIAPGGPIHPRLTMVQLASMLSQNQEEDPAVGRVIDATGLTGTYDMTLTKEATGWLTAAEHQLGLKLERRRVPVEYVTITKVEHPTAN